MAIGSHGIDFFNISFMYMCVYIYTLFFFNILFYIYIYIYRERERERERDKPLYCMPQFLHCFRYQNHIIPFESKRFDGIKLTLKVHQENYWSLLREFFACIKILLLAIPYLKYTYIFLQLNMLLSP